MPDRRALNDPRDRPDDLAVEVPDLSGLPLDELGDSPLAAALARMLAEPDGQPVAGFNSSV